MPNFVSKHWDPTFLKTYLPGMGRDKSGPTVDWAWGHEERTVAAVALGLTTAAVLAGCVGDEVGHVKIVNDTDRAVLIWRCARESCRGDFPSKDRFAAGEEGGPFNVSAVGVPNVFVVLEPQSMRHLGCLPACHAATGRRTRREGVGGGSVQGIVR